MENSSSGIEHSGTIMHPTEKVHPKVTAGERSAIWQSHNLE